MTRCHRREMLKMRNKKIKKTRPSNNKRPFPGTQSTTALFSISNQKPNLTNYPIILRLLLLKIGRIETCAGGPKSSRNWKLTLAKKTRNVRFTTRKRSGRKTRIVMMLGFAQSETLKNSMKGIFSTQQSAIVTEEQFLRIFQLVLQINWTRECMIFSVANPSSKNDFCVRSLKQIAFVTQ